MDKLNPRDADSISKAYEKIIEQLPYDGIHINHQSKIDHIKSVYGSTYKVTQSPTTKSWYVLGKNGGEWLPVTNSFNDQAGATKFMQWLTKAGEMQKQMVGTITGDDKRLNEEYECPCGEGHKKGECPMKEEKLDESLGSALHNYFFNLYDFLEMSGVQDIEKVLPKLKGSLDKLYATWKKLLKGKGLSGW